MKSINSNAPVKCSKAILIRASAKEVWTVLTTINEWPTWQTDIGKSVMNGPLKPGTAFKWRTGGANIVSVLHTVDPGKLFGWTGKTFGMFAIHNWELLETNGQTKVVAEESLEGFLARVFQKSFNRNLEKGMVLWLELLKKECEK